LGKLICELSEELVQIHWDREIMYLHVEQSNTAAQALYLGMGYELATPGLSAWEKKMEGIENILYYSNSLKRHWVKKADQVLKVKEVTGAVDADSVLLGINQLDMAVASNIMRSKA
jgi:phosphoribosyl-AMP cyclohydrolase